MNRIGKKAGRRRRRSSSAGCGVGTGWIGARGTKKCFVIARLRVGFVHNYEFNGLGFFLFILRT